MESTGGDNAVPTRPEGREAAGTADDKPWLILVVDPDPAVHEGLKSALRDYRYAGRPVHLVDAFSTEQAQRVLPAVAGVAVSVLSAEDAEKRDEALELAHHIRDQLGNRLMRLVLRIGGRHDAPDPEVIDRFDVFGYLAKDDVVPAGVRACVTTALRDYERVLELDEGRARLARLNHELEVRVRERTRDHAATRQRLESILDAVLFPIVIMRRGDYLVRYANRRFGELFGVPVEVVLESRTVDFFEDVRDRTRVLRLLAHLGRFDDEEVRLRRTDGSVFWALMSGVVMEYAGESCILTTFTDISERKAMEIELQRLATTDELTGAATRRHFLDLAGQELRRARRFTHPLSVLVFDIDHFKAVNDQCGHAAGDAVLRVVAEAVRKVLREVDTFGRIGGEEFAVVLPETEPQDAAVVGERLRKAIRAMKHGVEGLGPVTVSIGVAGLRDSDGGLEDLMDRADAALYRAKRQGRNQVQMGDGGPP